MIDQLWRRSVGRARLLVLGQLALFLIGGTLWLVGR